MFSTQLEQIQRQKEKAFSIFHKTRVKLLQTIDQANQHIYENDQVIIDNNLQNQELTHTNDQIIGHINEIRGSLGQIDAIIGTAQGV